MDNQLPTIKQLEDLQKAGYQKVKDWIKYLEDLNDYITAVKNDTVPPGTPPPPPPGH